MLSKIILMVKFMRKNNFKIQMLVRNRLKICVGTSSQISTTLVILIQNIKRDLVLGTTSNYTHISYGLSPVLMLPKKKTSRKPRKGRADLVHGSHKQILSQLYPSLPGILAKPIVVLTQLM